MNQLRQWAARVHHRWVLRRQRRTYRRLFAEPDVRVVMPVRPEGEESPP